MPRSIACTSTSKDAAATRCDSSLGSNPGMEQKNITS